MWKRRVFGFNNLVQLPTYEPNSLEVLPIVLPPVISEREFFPFKFWFNNSIQDGMFYRNELFYRLYSIELNHRAQLYHYACKLAQNSVVVVSTTENSCSVWVSLRSKCDSP